MGWKFRVAPDASMESEISQYASAGFRQSYSAIELPPYAALNAAAFKWHVEIAQKTGELSVTSFFQRRVSQGCAAIRKGKEGVSALNLLENSANLCASLANSALKKRGEFTI